MRTSQLYVPADRSAVARARNSWSVMPVYSSLMSGNADRNVISTPRSASCGGPATVTAPSFLAAASVWSQTACQPVAPPLGLGDAGGDAGAAPPQAASVMASKPTHVILNR